MVEAGLGFAIGARLGSVFGAADGRGVGEDTGLRVGIGKSGGIVKTQEVSDNEKTVPVLLTISFAWPISALLV